MRQGVDYLVFHYPMPTRVRAFVCKRCEDDMNVIIVNSNLSKKVQMIALEHELAHVASGDLTEVDCPAYLLERRIEYEHPNNLSPAETG